MVSSVTSCSNAHHYQGHDLIYLVSAFLLTLTLTLARVRAFKFGIDLMFCNALWLNTFQLVEYHWIMTDTCPSIFTSNSQNSLFTQNQIELCARILAIWCINCDLSFALIQPEIILVLTSSLIRVLFGVLDILQSEIILAGNVYF